MAPKADGSWVWHTTSWVTVDEAAKYLSIPTDTLRPKLMNQGIYADQSERWPLHILVDAVLREGYVREPLLPVRR